MNRSDIIHKKFSRAFRGYEPSEVDAFLDDIVREMDLLEQAVKLAETREELLESQLKRDLKE